MPARVISEARVSTDCLGIRGERKGFEAGHPSDDAT